MRKGILVLSVFCLFFICVYTQDPTETPESPPPECKVINVIDCEMIALEYNGVPTAVKLLGVNASGIKTKVFLNNLLLGECVWVKFDETGPKKDRNGRLLAYFYRTPEGLFVNQEIIRQGYGRTNSLLTFKHKEIFLKYEKRAKDVKKGIWSSTTTSSVLPTTTQQKSDITVYIANTGKKYHLSGCRSLKKSKIPISLNDAKRKGYEPCSICKPPK